MSGQCHPLSSGSGEEVDEVHAKRLLGAASCGRDSLPYLETLSNDSDGEIAQEGLRCLRILRARLG